MLGEKGNLVLILLFVLAFAAGLALWLCGGVQCLASKRSPSPSPPPTLSFPESPAREKSQIAVTAPLILVPGILGSWTKDPDVIHEQAEIGDLKDWAITEDQIGYIMGNVFGHLKYRLGVKGYELGKDFYNAPYDWRQSMSNHRAIMDWITYAKAEFKLRRNKVAEQVDIIAHSFGGLVVRSYIQSNDYRNDIRSLAIVASPNFGAPDAYYMWAGGTVPPTSGVGFATFLNSNLAAMNKKIAPEKGRPLVLFVRKYIASLRDLLPVAFDDPAKEGYLFDWPHPGTAFFPEMSPVNQNDILVSLNKGLSELQQRAKVQFFLAGGTKTLQQINVEMPVGSFGWEDGRPSRINNHKFGDGDGRVILNASRLSKTFPVSTTVADHQRAVCAFTPDIFKFLEIPVDKDDQCPGSGRRVESGLALTMTTTSKAELAFRDPSGTQYGYKGADVPKWSTGRYLYLLLREPKRGDYQLTLTGGAGTHHIFVNYVKEPTTALSLERTMEFVGESKEDWNIELIGDVLRTR